MTDTERVAAWRAKFPERYLANQRVACARYRARRKVLDNIFKTVAAEADQEGAS